MPGLYQSPSSGGTTRISGWRGGRHRVPVLARPSSRPRRRPAKSLWSPWTSI